MVVPDVPGANFPLAGLLAWSVLWMSVVSCKGTHERDSEVLLTPSSSSSAHPPTLAFQSGDWVIERWDHRFGSTSLARHQQHVRKATAREGDRYEVAYALPLSPDVDVGGDFTGMFSATQAPTAARPERFMHSRMDAEGFVRLLESMPVPAPPIDVGASWPTLIPFLTCLPVVFRTGENTSARVERLADGAVVATVTYRDPDPPPATDFQQVTASGTIELDLATRRPLRLHLDVQRSDHSHRRDLSRVVLPYMATFDATWEYGSGPSPVAP
jgi:hypothetical protein